MLKEFKTFVMRGSMLDMAVGIILGVAFGKIITSLVEDVIMPPIGLLLGKVDFSNLFINLSGTPYASLAEAKKAGAAVIGYGVFLNTIISFLIVAFVVFLIIRGVNRARGPQEAPVATKDCPFCLSKVPAAATKCPACTSQLEA